MLHILILRDGIWCDEGYSTDTENAKVDVDGFEQIFGVGNVCIMTTEEWEGEKNKKKQEAEEYSRIQEEQDKEYTKCLKQDQKREKEMKKQNRKREKEMEQQKKESIVARPPLDELRRRRCQFFDSEKEFRTRRVTRAMIKKTKKGKV